MPVHSKRVPGQLVKGCYTESFNGSEILRSDKYLLLQIPDSGEYPCNCEYKDCIAWGKLGILGKKNWELNATVTHGSQFSECVMLTPTDEDLLDCDVRLGPPVLINNTNAPWSF